MKSVYFETLRQTGKKGKTISILKKLYEKRSKNDLRIYRQFLCEYGVPTSLFLFIK